MTEPESAEWSLASGGHRTVGILTPDSAVSPTIRNNCVEPLWMSIIVIGWGPLWPALPEFHC